MSIRSVLRSIIAPRHGTTADAADAPLRYDDSAKSADVVAELDALEEANRASTRSVIDLSQTVVVSVTTHGPRIDRAHLALEAIARGTVRPGRLVLSLGASDAAKGLPEAIVRLQARGLEILVVEDGLGVHSKYWGVVDVEPPHTASVVLADDDQLYPADWLESLLAVAARHPDCLVAHRAHRVHVDGGWVRPYREWTPLTTDEPTFAALPTGVSGFLMPPAFLDDVRAAGTAFLERSPRNDDVWLWTRAVASGVRVVQTGAAPRNFEFVPETQHVGLYQSNVGGLGNDPQIAGSLDPGSIERISADPHVG